MEPDAGSGLSPRPPLAGRKRPWRRRCGAHGAVAAALHIARPALILALLAAGPLPAAAADPARIEPAPALLPPLAHPPLDPPLRITGSFGELRGGHFHAGLDFSTGGTTGRPVYAALSGFIERIRTSGLGYGRSLYLRAPDGRLLVMGHLDQFARPIAAYVAAIQDSSGQYEQDLWPDAARFPVHAGQVLGWSGRSGTVPPHLHFEVRRGDVAYNPLRAGIGLVDTITPVIAHLTLEPLDENSFVNRSAAPCTVELAGAPDTLLLEGRARAIVEATDGMEGARRTMAPWSLALESGLNAPEGMARTECHFDSASWASDMPEVDYVYDRGRVTGSSRFAMMLWAPAEFRPVVIGRTSEAGEIGTIALGRGEAARTLRLVARDVAGHATVREVVVRAPLAAERGPNPGAAAARAAGGKSQARASAYPGEPRPAGAFEFVALPGRHLRVIYRGAASGSRSMWFETSRSRRQTASLGGDGDWTAILPADIAGTGVETPLVITVGGEDGAGAPWTDHSPGYTVVPLEPDAAAESPAAIQPGWKLPRGGAFERTLALATPPLPEQSSGELTAAGAPVALLPASMPLHRGATVSLPLPPGRARDHVGLFVDDGSGWEFIGDAFDSTSRRMSGETRKLGRFALFTDTRGPAVTLLRVPHHAALKPYSHWAIEAKLDDRGSGVDARASHFVVGGRRVPSEWDDAVGILRWRPLQRPARGHHRYEVVAVDHTGNVTRRSGTFVID